VKTLREAAEAANAAALARTVARAALDHARALLDAAVRADVAAQFAARATADEYEALRVAAPGYVAHIAGEE